MYTQPFECPTCHLTHVHKTYHINLDGMGFAIVSQEVWAILQRLHNHGFEMVNAVEKPPAQTIAVGFAGKAAVIDHMGKEIVSVDS